MPAGNAALHVDCYETRDGSAIAHYGSVFAIANFECPVATLKEIYGN